MVTDALTVDLLDNGLQKPRNKGLALALGLLQPTADIFIFRGFEPLERLIFQLALKII